MIDNNKSVMVTKKITLIPVGDKEECVRAVQYVKDGCRDYNRAKNEYISALFSAEVLKLPAEDRDALKKLFQRVPDSKLESALSNDLHLPKGLPSASAMKRAVDSDFKKAKKEGLMYGRVSLPSYRTDGPMDVHVDYVRLRSTNPHIKKGLFHQYESNEEFMEHLYESDLEVFLDFASNITFRLNVGDSVKNARELRTTLGRIFDSTYEVGGSKMRIEDGVVVLYLCLKIPTFNLDLDENVAVGVNMGMCVPAYCALNGEKVREHKPFGSVADYFRVNKRIKIYKSRLHHDLVNTKGGHGRSRKLRPLENLKKYEHNWRTTYNHNISREIVKFAIRNKAKYINLEDLSGYASSLDKKFVEQSSAEVGEDSKIVTFVSPEDEAANNSKSAKNKKDNPKKKRFFFLKDWPYYQLQQFITYKASLYGIEVRYVNPAYDSQTCSYCGHYEEGQRDEKKRKEFVCKNPTCKVHGKIIDADFNAARNVALATEFIDKEAAKQEKKERKAQKAKENRERAEEAQKKIDLDMIANAAESASSKNKSKKANA